MRDVMLRAVPSAPAGASAAEAALYDQVRGLVGDSKAANTFATYNSSWKKFEAFCARFDPPRSPLPTDDLTFALFLADVQATANTMAPVDQAKCAVAAAHEFAGLERCPTSSALVAATLAGCKRRLGTAKTNQKSPFPADLVQRFAEKHAFDGAPQLELMMATWVSLSFAGFLRYADAAVILCSDVRFHADHMEVFIDSRKNDQFRAGSVVLVARGSGRACPVALTARLIAAGDLLGKDVPLFRAFDGRKRPVLLGTKPLEYARLRYKLLPMLADLLGLSLTETTRIFGMHSARIGGATQAAALDVPERVWKQHGGWRSEKAKDMYVKDTRENRLKVSRANGL